MGIDAIAFLAAIGSLRAGLVQLSYAKLTRVVSRRRLLGGGGLLFGGGFIAQAFATSFLTFAVPERPVADRRLAAAPGRQRPPRRAVPGPAPRVRDLRPHRRRQHRHGRRRPPRRAAASRRSAGAGRPSCSGSSQPSSQSRSSPSSASAAPTVPRQSPAATSATRSGGSLGDRDLRWLYLTSVLGGGGRGLGVVNLFVAALPQRGAGAPSHRCTGRCTRR